jgi:hypothetical protein
MRLCVLATTLVVLAYTVSIAKAEPLVTVYCDKPNGFNIAYGTTLKERVEAEQNKQQEPAPALRGPAKDDYSGRPTFIIDSNEKKMTVIWAELPEDVALRKKPQELNIPTLPPPAAAEATIVWFAKDQISAIDADPWSITTYSLYPMFGIAFIGEQSMDLGFHDTRQIATFAHCEFSWTNPNDDPRKKGHSR